MTQEEKDLVLQDLCARLAYRVIVDYSHNAFDVHKGNYVKYGTKCILKCYLLDIFMSPRQNEEGEYIKPYLRPMSSMTEEEKEEYLNIDNRSYSCPIDYAHIPASGRIDWLNRKMFDFRGLIPKDLAISTEVFNPYED